VHSEARQVDMQTDKQETEAILLATRVFRFLQLLCEGHHAGFQVGGRMHGCETGARRPLTVSLFPLPHA
jgi:hypothetical protein